MSFVPASAVTALATALEGVASVGVVHPYRRVIRTQPQLSTLLTDPAAPGVLNAAYVSVTAVNVARDHGGAASIGVMPTLTLQVELLRGVQDASASEVAFRQTIFDVLEVINRTRFYAEASHQGPMSAPEIGYLVFADAVLMHYARLTVDVRGRTAP